MDPSLKTGLTRTRRLYDDFPYNKKFDSFVVSSFPGKKEKTLNVILDATLFFPEEGGQTPDQGTLNGFPVVDVQISKNEVITHTISLEHSSSSLKDNTSLFAPGSSVHGILDWNYRFSNMQNHTGEHIVSGLLHTLYGYENVGFRLSDHTVTLDTSGILTKEQVLDLERRANEVVWNNVPVTCEYPDPSILSTLQYRCKKELKGAIRIVTIEGIDVCACCAPHVRHTGEIGLIKFLSAVHFGKNTTRITLVSGRRALSKMQEYQSGLEESSHLLNMPREETSNGIQRLKEELVSQKERNTQTEIKLIEARVSQILVSYPDPSQRSSQDIFLFEEGLSSLSLRSLMNELCDMGWRYAGVFCKTRTSEKANIEPLEEQWTYYIGSRKNDARIPNALLLDQLHARGGGKKDMVQGSVHGPEETIRAVLKKIE